MRTLEDFFEGQVLDLGTVAVTRDEIVEFARRYDPQPFHVDEEAAKETLFGGIIASGWHTASMTMRLLVDGLNRDLVTMGSPGMDEIRWLKPVRPGDRLSLRVRVLEIKFSRSKPDRGSMRLRQEVSNQNGEIVMTLIGTGIYGRRARAPEGVS